MEKQVARLNKVHRNAPASKEEIAEADPYMDYYYKHISSDKPSH